MVHSEVLHHNPFLVKSLLSYPYNIEFNRLRVNVSISATIKLASLLHDWSLGPTRNTVVTSQFNHADVEINFTRLAQRHSDKVYNTQHGIHCNGTLVA
jgi:hypothetical protein